MHPLVWLSSSLLLGYCEFVHQCWLGLALRSSFEHYITTTNLLVRLFREFENESISRELKRMAILKQTLEDQK